MTVTHALTNEDIANYMTNKRTFNGIIVARSIYSRLVVVFIAAATAMAPSLLKVLSRRLRMAEATAMAPSSPLRLL